MEVTRLEYRNASAKMNYLLSISILWIFLVNFGDKSIENSLDFTNAHSPCIQAVRRYLMAGDGHSHGHGAIHG